MYMPDDRERPPFVPLRLAGDSKLLACASTAICELVLTSTNRFTSPASATYALSLPAMELHMAAVLVLQGPGGGP